MHYPTKPWKLHILHHSHTDIGYTDRQEKIERYHVNFIKQAIEISEAAHAGKRPEWKGFRWICETFWAVERFLLSSGSDWRERFKQAVLRGDVEVTGNYLNFTELLDEELLAASLRRAQQYANESGLTIRSAMTADINGYAWGYAQGLLDAGVENLFSCVHTHHGMFPLGRKQIPFWWETAGGERLLVWNGDHYHLGNELGLAPKAIHSYMIRDEFDTPPIMENHFEFAETRIGRYVRQLEEEQYPYDFAPIMVSGLITDNSPPNTAIVDFVKQWNAKHGHRIELELTTLQGFFDTLRASDADIPVHRGDWPDWWSDGVSSTALSTQLFRDAQRMLQSVRALDTAKRADDRMLDAAEYNLMMYAEHTWGYSSSIGEPWHPMVQALEARKAQFAAEAHRLVYSALDDVLESRGEVSLSAETDLSYLVLNPQPSRKTGLAALHVHYWQLPVISQGFEILNETTGDYVAHQKQKSARGTLVVVPYDLAAGSEARYRIIPAQGAKPAGSTSSFLLIGADGVIDAGMTEDAGAYPVQVRENTLTSPYVRIRWQPGEGIVSWLDTASGRELLREDRDHGAFTPVYEVTPVADRRQTTGTRTRMGRNRKGEAVRRTAGRMTAVNRVEQGPLMATVELIFETDGIDFYSVFVTAYALEARVDVKVRMHKQSVWEPENVYLSLPFRAGLQGEQLWAEKTGTLFRPAVDQLPGTGTDFYCIQEGAALWANGTGIAIGMPDTPLLQTGALAFGPRKLTGHPALGDEKQLLYAWALNNYWETNFKASVGGFYEFRFPVRWGSFSDPAEAVHACRLMNAEPNVIKVADLQRP